MGCILMQVDTLLSLGQMWLTVKCVDSCKKMLEAHGELYYKINLF